MGGLVGCASPQAAPDVADLEGRVRSWWAARQAGDVGRMYEMLEPSYRQSHSFAEFQAHAPRLTRILVENLRIASTSPVPDSGRVIVVLLGTTRLPRTGKAVEIIINDPWVLDNGQWWRIDVPPQMPFK